MSDWIDPYESKFGAFDLKTWWKNASGNAEFHNRYAPQRSAYDFREFVLDVEAREAIEYRNKKLLEFEDAGDHVFLPRSERNEWLNSWQKRTHVSRNGVEFVLSDYHETRSVILDKENNSVLWIKLINGCVGFYNGVGRVDTRDNTITWIGYEIDADYRPYPEHIHEDSSGINNVVWGHRGRFSDNVMDWFSMAFHNNVDVDHIKKLSCDENLLKACRVSDEEQTIIKLKYS